MKKSLAYYFDTLFIFIFSSASSFAQAEFIPSQQWSYPKIMSGLSSTDSYNLPAFSMHLSGNNTRTANFDLKDKYYSCDITFGAKARQELSSGWAVINNEKYAAKFSYGCL
jgi:hypothetical protein